MILTSYGINYSKCIQEAADWFTLQLKNLHATVLFWIQLQIQSLAKKTAPVANITPVEKKTVPCWSSQSLAVLWQI